MHDDPRQHSLEQPPQTSVCDSPGPGPPIERRPEVVQLRDLKLQRVDQPAVRPTDPAAAATASSEDQKTARRRRSRRPDPVTQSLMLLATMGVMLVAARFAVPRIVEEIRFAWHRGELRAEYELGTAGLQNVSLDALSQAYQMVSSAVGPTVVHIDVQRRPLMDPAIMAQMLSSGVGPRKTFALPASDQGSGVVVDSDGYVLTNRHVIADGEDITVTLSDGRRVPAVVVGTDGPTDLAVLKIDADRLMPIHWGDSDRCKVGSPVWAVGSPFGLDRTVTFGIISGKHRKVRASTQYQDFMQSDVAVNPGNSGGPLVDSRGTLVGINTAIVGDTYQGVSFSIPSNVAKQVYRRLRATGRVERGYLGVGLTEVTDHQLVGDDPRVRGAMVSGLASHSPAGIAGLKMGDLVLSVDGNPVRGMGHLMRMIGDLVAGSTVNLMIHRDAETREMRVVLGSRPETLDLE
jgi:serine protease Do